MVSFNRHCRPGRQLVDKGRLAPVLNQQAGQAEVETGWVSVALSWLEALQHNEAHSRQRSTCRRQQWFRTAGADSVDLLTSLQLMTTSESYNTYAALMPSAA